MTFDEKVKFLRTLPLFKVAAEVEIRAIAFVAKEKDTVEENDIALSIHPILTITRQDREKIVREYPDLIIKLR